MRHWGVGKVLTSQARGLDFNNQHMCENPGKGACICNLSVVNAEAGGSLVPLESQSNQWVNPIFSEVGLLG